MLERDYVSSMDKVADKIVAAGLANRILITGFVKDFDMSSIIGLNGFLLSTFDSVSFTHCDFRGSVFDSCSFRKTQFINCVLDKSSISNSDFDGAVFENCSMQSIGFSSSHISKATISKCNITNARGLNKKPSAAPKYDFETAVLPFVRQSVKCIGLRNVPDEFSQDPQLGPRLHRVSGIVWARPGSPGYTASKLTQRTLADNTVNKTRNTRSGGSVIDSTPASNVVSFSKKAVAYFSNKEYFFND